MRVIVATRRSPLALAQSQVVATALRAGGHDARLVPMTTTGDSWSLATPPDSSGGDVKGMFVKELEEALLDGRADIAVHSAKDLPTDLLAGLAIIATPPREDPRDVLVGSPGGLAALPAGARVGTTSPRRRAQVLAARPDVHVVEVRGNVDTRLARLDAGDLDALVLAAAGLNRLGIARGDMVILPLDVCLPAAGQGIVAIEGRTSDPEIRRACAVLDDPAARVSLTAERAFLARLGGGCSVPAAALCEVDGTDLRMRAWWDATGRSCDIHGSADDPVALGIRAALEVGAP
ncbi:MAG: hydroxymethylbilane synthase [Thermoleophilia bacterium]|nr:hydroxymethylbilane synthase [Thermoleophilia bacterium]